MDFNAAVDKFMRDVKDGTTEPSLLYRDKNGDWHCDHTQNQYGDTFDWVEDAKAADPFAVTLTGESFSRGSFPFVYDKVLAARLRAEYEATAPDAINPDELHALVNFLEENMGELSFEATEYIAQFDKPLEQLFRMIPANLSISYPGEHYDTDAAWQAFEVIEDRIELLIKRSAKDEVAAPAKRVIEGYEEHICIPLAGKEVVIAENPSAEQPYLVCNIKYDNPLGMEERYDGVVTNDYMEAICELLTRVNALVEQIQAERRESGIPIQVMTAKDCLPGSQDMNWEGKPIIIKPEALAPEYRDAGSQLVICTGGFGTTPNSRGSKVYVKELLTGKECYYRSHQIAGVADPSKMPEWAKTKLTAMDKTDAQLNKECAAAIDGAVSAEYTPGEMAGTGTYRLDAALKTLTDSFGAERVNTVLAAIVNKHDYDGRYSQTNKNWAKSVDAVPYDDIKYATVKTHPAVLDGLVNKARKADAERQVKKPSLLGKLDDNKEKVERGRAERSDKPVTKRTGDLEVD